MIAASLVCPLPDFGVPLDMLLPLGDCVRYSHRAAVARWSTINMGGGYRYSEWRVGEGTDKGWRPHMSDPPEGRTIHDLQLGFERDPWYNRPRDDGTNKTVIVWPEEGEAILFGFVRRGVGRSWPASGGTGGLFDDSYEPGGFAADGFAPLYALKKRLEGVSYLLAPVWAVSSLEADKP